MVRRNVQISYAVRVCVCARTSANPRYVPEIAETDSAPLMAYFEWGIRIGERCEVSRVHQRAARRPKIIAMPAGWENLFYAEALGQIASLSAKKAMERHADLAVE